MRCLATMSSSRIGVVPLSVGESVPRLIFLSYPMKLRSLETISTYVVTITVKLLLLSVRCFIVANPPAALKSHVNGKVAVFAHVK